MGFPCFKQKHYIGTSGWNFYYRSNHLWFYIIVYFNRSEKANNHTYQEKHWKKWITLQQPWRKHYSNFHFFCRWLSFQQGNKNDLDINLFWFRPFFKTPLYYRKSVDSLIHSNSYSSKENRLRNYIFTSNNPIAPTKGIIL